MSYPITAAREKKRKVFACPIQTNRSKLEISEHTDHVLRPPTHHEKDARLEKARKAWVGHDVRLRGCGLSLLRNEAMTLNEQRRTDHRIKLILSMKNQRYEKFCVPEPEKWVSAPNGNESMSGSPVVDAGSSSAD